MQFDKLALGLVFLFGCGHAASNPAGPSGTGDTHDRSDGMDVANARLKKAQGILHECLGHELELVMDPALGKPDSFAVQAFWIEALEQVIRLCEGSQDNPIKHQFIQSSLKSLHAEYAPNHEGGSAKFHSKEGRLVFQQDGLYVGQWFSGTLRGAIDDEFDRFRQNKYSGSSAASVSESEQSNYFAALISKYKTVDPGSQTEASLRTDPNAEIILQVLALWPKVVEPKLKERVGAWLVGSGRDYFGYLSAKREPLVVRHA